jgi:hypothetical protein
MLLSNRHHAKGGEVDGSPDKKYAQTAHERQASQATA